MFFYFNNVGVEVFFLYKKFKLLIKFELIIWVLYYVLR